MGAPRKPRPATVATSDLGAFLPSSDWRELVDDGIDLDLDRLTVELERQARWSRVGADTLPEIPAPSSDPVATIDLLDAWLIHADAPLDLMQWIGRRRSVWRHALDAV